MLISTLVCHISPVRWPLYYFRHFVPLSRFMFSPLWCAIKLNLFSHLGDECSKSCRAVQKSNHVIAVQCLAESCTMEDRIKHLHGVKKSLIQPNTLQPFHKNIFRHVYIDWKDCTSAMHPEFISCCKQWNSLIRLYSGQCLPLLTEPHTHTPRNKVFFCTFNLTVEARS